MFKGIGRLGMDAFSFSFSNGKVTGPNYSFDLSGMFGGMTPAEKDFYCSNPGMLITFVQEDWNKKFNPQCIISGGNLNLGVEWDVACLTLSGTPNLLSAATSGIQSAVAAWGKTALSCTTPTTTQPPPGTYIPPPSGGGALVITPSGPKIPQSTAPPDFFGGLGTIGIVAAIAVVILLAMKR